MIQLSRTEHVFGWISYAILDLFNELIRVNSGITQFVFMR